MKKIFQNIGVRVSLITVIINFLLFVLKLVFGIISHSKAIVSDAFHSLSDVITTIAVIVGLILSSKAADERHPYGHEKIEALVGIILAFVLLLSGISIGYIGFANIISSKEIVVPGVSALVVAIISILVKEGMFQYTIRVAKKLSSPSMKADAWHHRSDALSSVGSFIGVFLARIGYPIFDPICSILIAILIIKCAVEIFLDGTNQMIDTSCDSTLNKEIIDTILACYENIEISDFKTRMFGSKCYIDVEIKLQGDMPLKEVHNIVLNIHNKVEEKFKMVKHCNINVIPFE